MHRLLNLVLVASLIATSCGSKAGSSSEVRGEALDLYTQGQQYSASFSDREAFVENEIDQCMLTGGFQYFRRVPNTERTPETRESVELLGLGFAGAIGRPEFFRPESFEAPEKETYLASLSEEGRTEYGLSETSCREDAIERVNAEFPPPQPGDSDRVTDVLAVIDQAQADADQLLTERSLAWSRCMKSNGYEFDTFTQMMEHLFTDHRVNELRSIFESRVIENSDAGMEFPTVEVAFTVAELDEVQSFRTAEIELGLASWDCGSADLPTQDQLVDEALRQIADS